MKKMMRGRERREKTGEEGRGQNENLAFWWGRCKKCKKPKI